MPRAWSRHAPSVFYGLILLWINVYICREFFLTEDTGHRNAMHGFWMAMARLTSYQWWRPGWWPYWDAGMPFEYTYAPLVPATAIRRPEVGFAHWTALSSWKRKSSERS